MTNTVTFDSDGFAAVAIIEDGEVWRRAYAPGDDVSALSQSLQDEIAAAWTPEVIAAYQASLPEPDPPALPRTEGSFREFMALFTEAEQDAIYTAEAATAAAGDFTLKKWMDRAKGGATMRLQHSDTIAGVGMLVAAGLLTQKRADEILASDFDA
mgnify:CR=1 FL=1